MIVQRRCLVVVVRQQPASGAGHSEAPPNNKQGKTMDMKTVTAAIAISMCMYNYPIKVSTIKNEKHGQTNTQTLTRVQADLSQNIGVKHSCQYN